jgi:hypothetical protein
MMFTSRLVAVGIVAVLAAASPAFAGPPLLCHPFEIGSAKSLPWDGSNAWWQGRQGYNLQHLVADTEGLLTPGTPLIVRMETLRRAALYASLDPAAAARLLSAITARAHAAERQGAAPAATVTALFDAGYLTETYKQIAMLEGESQFRERAHVIAAVLGKADGRPLLNRALTLRPDDASLQFAAALVASMEKSDGRAAYRAHADKARKGAAQDALLARNIDKLS